MFKSCLAPFQRLTLLSVPSRSLNRPSPPPLPREEQHEFEQLLRKAQTPGSPSSTPDAHAMHPDARTQVMAEFEGSVNPVTGEEGGPKQEPVGHWGGETSGDWSFKGRVSDF